MSWDSFMICFANNFITYATTISYLKVFIFPITYNLIKGLLHFFLSFNKGTFPKRLLNMRLTAVGASTRGQPKVKRREWSADTRNIKAIQMNNSLFFGLLSFITILLCRDLFSEFSQIFWKYCMNKIEREMFF